MSIFKPRKIKDPRTGKERIVSPEEQEMMLLKGVLFDLPSEKEPLPPKNDDEPPASAK